VDESARARLIRICFQYLPYVDRTGRVLRPSTEAARLQIATSTRGERGEQTLDSLRTAIRAANVMIVIGHPAQLLEAVTAGITHVIVQRHRKSKMSPGNERNPEPFRYRTDGNLHTCSVCAPVMGNLGRNAVTKPAPPASIQYGPL